MDTTDALVIIIIVAHLIGTWIGYWVGKEETEEIEKLRAEYDRKE